MLEYWDGSYDEPHRSSTQAHNPELLRMLADDHSQMISFPKITFSQIKLSHPMSHYTPCKACILWQKNKGRSIWKNVEAQLHFCSVGHFQRQAQLHISLKGN